MIFATNLNLYFGLVVVLRICTLSDCVIEVEFSYTDDCEDAMASFCFDGDWYGLENFVRCDNPYWVLNDSSTPSYITAYDATDSWNPYHISFSDYGATVDVYERRDV